MKKRILVFTLSLCLIATTAFAGFADGGAFGATANYLKRVGTSIVPTVTNTYNLGSSTKVFGTIYATAVSVVNWTVSGTWYWTGGNVTYLALADDIETEIAAATAGDTLILAAGTYTVTTDITMGTKVHLQGQGQGVTTITCASDVIVISQNTAGVRISDMTISRSGAITGSANALIAIADDTDLENIEFIDTSTGAAGVFGASLRTITAASVVNVENCTFTATGAIGAHIGIQTGFAGGTVNVRNSAFSGSGGTAATYGVANIYLGAVTTLNVYNSSFADTTDTAGGVLFSETASTMNIYDSILNASGATAFDIKTTSGTATLYNTTLVNNTTSGTITYGGTVATGGIKVVGGASIGKEAASLIGFYGDTPVNQPDAVADSTDAASVILRLNELLARMRELGLIET